MNQGTEKTYEMLWDCEYCNKIKLLGKTHRHCPECGAAQNPEKRYFPEEQDKVAVEDHEYFGADVRCPACQAPNSARAKFCAECGAPLQGAAQVERVIDRDEATARPTPSISRSKKPFFFIILGVAVLIIAAVAVLLLWKNTVGIAVSGHTWEREIKIESFEVRNKSAWCDRKPLDAYSITKSKEVRSHRKIADGETCMTKKKDKGDGTYSQKRVCKTKYREEPVYDEKCRFKVNRWEYERSIKATGTSLEEQPVWPTVTLRKQGTTLGSERQGQSVERYTVHFVDGEQKTSSCDFPEANWRAFAYGSQWNAKAAVLTGILDCASLRPLETN